MTREEQLKLLAELYARVEDGEADIHNVQIELDPFSGDKLVRIEGTSQKDLKSAVGNGVYQVKNGGSTTINLPASYYAGRSITIKDVNSTIKVDPDDHILVTDASDASTNGIYQWDGSATPYASVSLKSDGTDWHIVDGENEEI